MVGEFHLRERTQLKGATYGVRVAGEVFATLWFVVLSGLLAAYGFAPGVIPFVAYALFLAVRPWFMKASLSGVTLEIRSWFRVYRIDLREVRSIDLSKYSGLAGFAVGFVPFVGQVRVLHLAFDSGKSKDFPATIGRRRRVQAIAKLIQNYAVQVGSDPRLGDCFYD